ncbi:class 1b ribonucleoside-diphosphate reductase subunit beta [Lactobacillus sp. 3B(2020)]|uniref:class 1b ribonucleoside-diphosphate reductase subunit beta n=1 Tax=Lactobacillus sp. 3B(2020) TaxID=2695882 RepID=UPI0015DED713|nr:class 1b ribonucleoside-diphosphate reductase subunit beta [Lactobacillus sp. 3B(2020)]QLL70738.1 class 1b ribonucleoside-diphosphate reductase subunit beta [Lactobacillus sp. 3B(2020)]
MTYHTINWNIIEDEFDEYVWDKATAQFWLDTRVPVSHDLGDWRQLSENEKAVINKVVGGLALLDTLQSEEGVNVMRVDARTRKEIGVINDFLMMESIHAKSYGTILISLNDQQTIDDTYQWMNNDPRMQYKVKRINEIYQNGNNLQKKVASVFLEGILYYSNFFTPLWYRGQNQLANLSEIIKLVIRDESVHGTYLGYKFQKAFQELTSAQQQTFRKWMDNLLADLLDNEFKFTDQVYAPLGETFVADVKQFVKYNANKAMNNMGFDAIFDHAAIEDINPIVMNGISTETANHDFFSQVGAGYLMGEAETMTDQDYNF